MLMFSGLRRAKIRRSKGLGDTITVMMIEPEMHEAAIDNSSIMLFPVNMKNITVTVDEETYHRARVRAAERRTSLSAIVREILVELAAEETEAERLRRQEDEIILRLQERGSEYSAARRLTREEIHDRHALR
ncbi:MAG: hypothetical protein MUF13_17235 [Akkermansiaceae bacterium]|nr:hypothetical protein [Akkermansiaceae bacterium]